MTPQERQGYELAVLGCFLQLLGALYLGPEAKP